MNKTTKVLAITAGALVAGDSLENLMENGIGNFSLTKSVSAQTTDYYSTSVRDASRYAAEDIAKKLKNNKKISAMNSLLYDNNGARINDGVDVNESKILKQGTLEIEHIVKAASKRAAAKYHIKKGDVAKIEDFAGSIGYNNRVLSVIYQSACNQLKSANPNLVQNQDDSEIRNMPTESQTNASARTNGSALKRVIPGMPVNTLEAAAQYLFYETFIKVGAGKQIPAQHTKWPVSTIYTHNGERFLHQIEVSTIVNETERSGGEILSQAKFPTGMKYLFLYKLPLSFLPKGMSFAAGAQGSFNTSVNEMNGIKVRNNEVGIDPQFRLYYAFWGVNQQKNEPGMLLNLSTIVPLIPHMQFDENAQQTYQKQPWTVNMGIEFNKLPVVDLIMNVMYQNNNIEPTGAGAQENSQGKFTFMPGAEFHLGKGFKVRGYYIFERTESNTATPANTQGAGISLIKTF